MCGGAGRRVPPRPAPSPSTGTARGQHARLLATAVLLAAVLAGCGGGDGLTSPAVVHPAGETADVGGWLPAETLLEGYTTIIEPSGSAQSSGWQVSVSASGPCAPGPADAGEEYVCATVDIENTTSGPGALDLANDSPELIDQEGDVYPVAGAKLDDFDFLVAGSATGSISSSMDCEFSAPDESGRQQADCTAMLTAAMSSEGFDEALVAVGAGKSTTLELAFLVRADGDGWTMVWPDGTGFELY
jgi:hypothetical protein